MIADNYVFNDMINQAENYLKALRYYQEGGAHDDEIKIKIKLHILLRYLEPMAKYKIYHWKQELPSWLVNYHDKLKKRDDYEITYDFNSGVWKSK